MRLKIFRRWLLLAVCLFAAAAVADTVSFVPVSSGKLASSSQSFVGGGASITATSLYYNGSSWVVGGLLFGRNDGGGDEQGLGVCSPNESTSACYATGTGGGDTNELSNQTNPELIRLELPAGYTWTSFQLSSLDNNGGTPLEHGMVFAGANAIPTGLPGALSNETSFCTFAAGSPVTVGGTCAIASGANSSSPTFTVPTAMAGAQYLFFEAYNFDDPSKTNNDYLIRAATVPEPGATLLLGFGLLGMTGRFRRKRAK